MNPLGQVSKKSIRRKPVRIAWIGGRRGELLSIAPLFRHFRKRYHDRQLHWLCDTGEDGMASSQALDYLKLVPDKTSDLCHPAEETVLRIRLMIDRSESFMRHCKADAAVFSGCGPTALAASICCMTRRSRGLWLKPSDPAGVIRRFTLESCYQRMIHASFPPSDIVNLDYHVPTGMTDDGGQELNPEVDLPDYREKVPRLLVHVQRREWNIKGSLSERLAHMIAAWARRRPGADYLVLGNLNACTERPVRIHAENLGNYMIAPPLPYPLYLRLMRECSVVLTDSPLVATEALQHAKPLAVLGELEEDGQGGVPFVQIRHVTPDTLSEDADPLDLMDVNDVASGMMPPTGEPASPDVAHQMAIDRIEGWVRKLEAERSIFGGE